MHADKDLEHYFYFSEVAVVAYVERIIPHVRVDFNGCHYDVVRKRMAMIYYLQNLTLKTLMHGRFISLKVVVDNDIIVDNYEKRI